MTSLFMRVRCHRAGDLTAAAVLYEAILSRHADHADACHLLGVLRHQQGQSALAVELIGKAVALRPSVSAFHANLAEAYRASWPVRAGHRLLPYRVAAPAGLSRGTE